MCDPTREDIDEFLEAHLDLTLAQEDEVDVERAIYWFAADSHGGQGSNLYSVLSTSSYRPGMIERSPDGEASTAGDVYDLLISEYLR